MTRPASLFLLTLALLAAPVGATEVPELGSLDFANSGTAEAQQAFARGALLLHSFEYEDAREAFVQARQIDPDFALAYWGEAMTHNHPLWRQQDRDAALAALARYAPTSRDRAAKAPTEREAAYLAALDLLYGDGDKLDRDRAYSEAMGALAARYPEDLEARAFYALSILGTAQGERDFSTYMRAGAVAEEVFAANGRHPGAAHYLIHSYDDPVHAPLGLRAARIYNEIAPAASHAQHMISHIFVAMGRWEDSVESNIKAYEVSRERRERKGLPVDSLNYHALHWLQYSYLQLGQLDKARSVLDTMGGYTAESGTSRSVWHYAVMRAMWNVATGGLDAPPAIDMEVLELGGLAQDLFGDGYVAVSRGDVGAAKQALTDLGQHIAATATAALESETGGYDAAYAGSIEVAEVLSGSLAGLIELAEGRDETAVALFDEATALEAGRPLEYGPPDIVKPSHELYGEVLLRLDRPAEAIEQFEIALGRAPRRTPSLLGLAAAARAVDDSPRLASACAELSSILRHSDSAAEPEACAAAVADVAP